MIDIDAHWARLVSEVKAAIAKDGTVPPLRETGSKPDAQSKFCHIGEMVPASELGDPETKFDYDFKLDYKKGSLWVECVFRKQGGGSHSYDIIRSYLNHSDASGDLPLSWKNPRSQERVIMMIIESGATQVRPSQAAEEVVRSFKSLRDCIDRAIRSKPY